MWIVSFEITDKNSKEIIYFGRQRWRIENEGFNIQKNVTFDIEHIYSQNYNAIKAHYFFIQFAHTIRQLLEKGINVLVVADFISIPYDENMTIESAYEYLKTTEKYKNAENV